MNQQQVTNAEIARRIDVMLNRLDAIGSGGHGMKTALWLMDVRVQTLEQEVEQHRRMLFGQNGGLEKPGIVDDIRDLRRMIGRVSRALWVLTSSILGALGLWLAHVTLGLRW